MFQDSHNHLLAALPPDLADHLAGVFRPVFLDLYTGLQSVGEAPPTVYFPSDMVASVLVRTESGRGLEALMIGNEGAIGLPLFDSVASLSDVTVQHAGACLAISRRDFQKHLQLVPEFAYAMNSFTSLALMTLSQTAACNRFHSVEARAACWLLRLQDRAGTDAFYVTQEQLAESLGVQRPAVTVAVGDLRRARMIDYRYGEIVIVDRTRLAAEACECYPAVRRIELTGTS